jgi:hypothetical protein
MKRKIKKYAEGKAVTTRSDDEIEWANSKPMGGAGQQYPGEGWKQREKEQGEKNWSAIKNFFGGKKEDSSSKFDELESVGGASRRPRTIQEQIGGKSEEAPRRKYEDYIKKSEPEKEHKPTGTTFLRQEADIDYKSEPAKKVVAKKTVAKKEEKVGTNTTDDKPAKYESDKAKIGSQGDFKFDTRKQGVIKYEKGRSMSDWSRNLGKRPEPTEDEEDKPPKGVNIGAARGRKKGGVIRSASARADGCAIRGKTRA